jgi:hypothetical protein
MSFEEALIRAGAPFSAASRAVCATPAQAKPFVRQPHAGPVAYVDRGGLSLWLGEGDSAGPRVVYASTSSFAGASWQGLHPLALRWHGGVCRRSRSCFRAALGRTRPAGRGGLQHEGKRAAAQASQRVQYAQLPVRASTNWKHSGMSEAAGQAVRQRCVPARHAVR